MDAITPSDNGIASFSFSMIISFMLLHSFFYLLIDEHTKNLTNKNKIGNDVNAENVTVIILR